MNRENLVVVVSVSGEHILGEKVPYDPEAEYAEFNHENYVAVVLENPVQLAPSPDPSKQGQLIFLPYLQLTTLTTIPFPRYDVRHVLTHVKEDLIDVYAKIFGSGIQVPSKEIILG